MISCRTFREEFTAMAADPKLLEHVRTCDACLDYAAAIDPDIMFRAIGGGDLVPPGGVDAFVDDVMRQVRVRAAAKVVSVPDRWTWRRLSAAAAIAAGVTGAALFYQYDHRIVPAAVPPRPVAAANYTTKPVVETYESEKATIVEVPAGEASGAQVVMIFDDSLPADL
ncbi:MAG: hypothetical protein ACXV5L_01750 [Thermoanaerobaculia bacterium]